MKAAYLYRNRPPSIGCQPDGYIPEETQAWMPARRHPDVITADVPPRHLAGFYFLGRVVYPDPLTPEQVWQYELHPEDPIEWAEYVFWREGPEAAWLREDYLMQSIEVLQQALDDFNSPKALAALILKQAMEEGCPPSTPAS